MHDGTFTNISTRRRVQAIPTDSPVVTLREAGRRLGREPDYPKGYGDAMGVAFFRVGPAICMTEDDFARMLRHMKARKLTGARAD